MKVHQIGEIQAIRKPDNKNIEFFDYPIFPREMSQKETKAKGEYQAV